MQAPGRPDEDRRGGFEHGGWAGRYMDPVLGSMAGEGMAKPRALVFAAPTWAQAAQTTEAFIVLSGRADVPQGQQVGDLVVFHGSADRGRK